MKKILFATTALIATTGMAAAEYTIGGSARFGLAYTEGAAEETRIEQRMRVNITGIAETDGGVKFEARFRLEANEAADSSISGRGPGAAGFAVSTGGFRLDVGNVSDVFDSGDVINYYGYGIGLTALIEHNTAFYSTPISVGGFGAGDQDATTIKAKYSVGDFTVSASYSDDKVADNTETQFGVGYSFGDWNVGAAYGNDDVVDDYWAITADASFGDLGVSAIVGDGDSFDDAAYGFGVNYAVNSATNVTFVFSDGGNADDSSYGLGFSYGLGGGVTLAGGVASDRGTDKADLGVKFSF